jgi:hypothetical protein
VPYFCPSSGQPAWVGVVRTCVWPSVERSVGGGESVLKVGAAELVHRAGRSQHASLPHVLEEADALAREQARPIEEPEPTDQFKLLPAPVRNPTADKRSPERCGPPAPRLSAPRLRSPIAAMTCRVRCDRRSRGAFDVTDSP